MNSRLSRFLLTTGLVFMLTGWTHEIVAHAQRADQNLAFQQYRSLVGQIDKQALEIASIRAEINLHGLDIAVLKSKSDDSTWWNRLIASAVTLQLIAMLWSRKIKRREDQREE